MSVEPLFLVCITRICKDAGSYSDIINSLWDQVPNTLLNQILAHHSKNCRTIGLNYIKLVPSYLNFYRERICTDCYLWSRKWCSDSVTTVNHKLFVQYSDWKNMKNDFTCEYCGIALIIYEKDSCNCK